MDPNDNGILTWINADYLPHDADLPPPDPTKQRWVKVDIAHPHYGPVRITMVLRRFSHYKNHHYTWMPWYAVQLDPNAPKPGSHRVAANEPTDWRGIPGGDGGGKAFQGREK